MSDFTPNGYSKNKTTGVFSDGTNQQRGDFMYNLGSGWTPSSYNKDKTSILVTDGVNEQRAVAVYNLGEGGSSSGSNSGGSSIPSLPDEDGTYLLKCIVSSGNKTLQWVSE